MRRINEMRIERRKNIDDIGMRQGWKRDHAFNEDGMSFTTMSTNDSGDFNFKFTNEKINRAIIIRMDSPIMMRAGRTDNGMKINRTNDFIINWLI